MNTFWHPQKWEGGSWGETCVFISSSLYLHHYWTTTCIYVKNVIHKGSVKENELDLVAPHVVVTMLPPASCSSIKEFRELQVPNKIDLTIRFFRSSLISLLMHWRILFCLDRFQLRQKLLNLVKVLLWFGWEGEEAWGDAVIRRFRLPFGKP